MKTTITAVALTIVAGVLTWLLLSLRTDSNDVKYIETHMHLQATYRDHGHIKKDWMAAAEQAIREMDDLGVSKCLLMPPPQGITNKSLYDYKVLIPIVKKYPNRFSLVGGGGSLNLMIQQAIEAGRVTDKMKGQFREKAKEIAAAGAVGFGEMTAMHFSFNPVHPFVTAPPNHPLFLELADISAETGLPIDLHMEAVAKDMLLSEWFKSPPNPKMLDENIKAFEKLLEHNPKARIVWQHVGWDNTGHLTTQLLEMLLSKHTNLYIGLKCLQKGQSQPENRPLVNNKLKKEWIELMKRYPDRFMLGSDFFYGIPGKTRPMPDSSKESRMIVNQLPDEIKEKVAHRNAKIVYSKLD